MTKRCRCPASNSGPALDSPHNRDIMQCFGECEEDRCTRGGTMRNRIAMCSGILAIALGLALAAVAQAQAPPKHPITFDDLIKMHRVSGSQVSRDGKWVAYAVSTPDMELNR